MRPKILCLTSHDLDAPEYGSVIRAKNIFRFLNEIGDVNVVLAGAYEGDAGKRKSSNGGFPLAGTMKFHPAQKFSFLEQLRHEFDPRFINTQRLQTAAGGREQMAALIAAHDLIWIHGLRPISGFDIFRWPRSVLDIDDIPSSLEECCLAQSTGISDKFRHWRQMTRWRRREEILSERFDAICVCSESDRRKLGAGNKIFVVPNGFTTPSKNFQRRPAAPPRIGFVGKLIYPPNHEGIQWFLARVWPLILAAAPQTRLRVAGAGAEKIRGGLQNVDYLGWIADVESEMQTWSLSVVPLLVGGGTRIKIAEAFSRKCPVVSTTIGAHGYDVRDGHEILLADLPEDFAAKCLQILKNPGEGEIMAENAWQKFLANWTWDSIGNQVAKTVESVLRKTPPR